MRRPPTRTCVSIRRDVYDRLRAYCEGIRDADGAQHLNIGPTVDDIITDALDAEEAALARMMAAKARSDQLAADHPPGTCQCGACPDPRQLTLVLALLDDEGAS